MSEENQGTTPTSEELKAALKAFKKRLKVLRLDEESGIAGGPLSGGKKSAIVAIEPPGQFAQAVWDELVRQGKLKRSARGLYELAQE
jgi:hypothetical protein